MTAATMARSIGICAHRIWNFAVERNAEKCIPMLMELAALNIREAPHDNIFRHKGHENCSPAYCHLSDTDSTYTRQLHKCQKKQCTDILRFPPDNFGRRSDIWWLDEESSHPYRASDRAGGRHVDYMAISHVWADGTGAGLQEPGTVNRCLFVYFQQWARQLGCSGICWDTISIPQDREARRRAMNNINGAFRKATRVLVHDEYLAHFPWSDDGSPCVALLLSPWFSRAWT